MRADRIMKMQVTSSVRLRGKVIVPSVYQSTADEVDHTVKERVRSALNLEDRPAKPLKKGYAMFKSNWVKRGKSYRYRRVWAKRKRYTKPIPNQRLGLGIRAVRDLTLTGEMLNNLTIRRCDDKRIVYALTARGPRWKARANAAREEWLGFSPKNQAAIRRVAGQAIVNRAKDLLLEVHPDD